jgi:hypothetical protein
MTGNSSITRCEVRLTDHSDIEKHYAFIAQCVIRARPLARSELNLLR